MEHLRAILESLGHPRILVLGDLILDQYTWADAERISPEAPVMVLRVEREEVRPGGASSVASLLRALETEVTLAGVVGDDGHGRILRRLIQEDGIDHQAVLLDRSRPTTSKERFVGRSANRNPHQILRVDREERRSLDASTERALVESLLSCLPDHDAVLISDYAKGTCTPGVLACVIEHCKAIGIPVFVDPARIQDYSRYCGATLLTPNRVEAELATGVKVDSITDGLAVAGRLSAATEGASILLKLDRDGMVLASSREPGRHFPTHSREVYDVTGAGDMVLAVVGMCRASGVDWNDTIQLANLAAGIEVGKVGVARVSRAEILTELREIQPSSGSKLVSVGELAVVADRLRQQAKRMVFTNGCFDLLHIGHVNYLQEAAQLGDVLVVGVNSDASVRRLKGNQRPIIGQHSRAAMLASLDCVHAVVIFDDDTPHRVLQILRPDVLVKGGTYLPSEVVGHEVVEGYGGKVCVTGRVDGVSTTGIVEQIRTT